MRLTPSHYMVLLGLISSIGLMLQGLPDWNSANTPAFWGGLLLQTATTLGAMFVQKPDNGARNRRVTDTPRKDSRRVQSVTTPPAAMLACVFLLLAAPALAQPQTQPGALVKWDYPTPEPVAVARFDVQFDAQPFVTAGKTQANDAQTPANHNTFSVAIPALTPGAHTVAIRACSSTAGCGPASTPFAFGVVVIPAPTGVRIPAQ